MHFKAPYVFIAPRARTSDGSNNATTIPQAERSNKMHWRFLLDFLLGRTMGVCGNSKERHHQPRVDGLFFFNAIHNIVFHRSKKVSNDSKRRGRAGVVLIFFSVVT